MILTALLAAGCGRESTDRPAGRTWPADAPSATVGCQRHEDCAVVVWDGPYPPDPCCDVRVGYLPIRVAYLSWMKDYRERHCAGVSCPTPPLPGAEPTCCAGHARCVNNTCVSACKDPSVEMPHVSVLDPSCSIPVPQ